MKVITVNCQHRQNNEEQILCHMNHSFVGYLQQINYTSKVLHMAFFFKKVVKWWYFNYMTQNGMTELKAKNFIVNDILNHSINYNSRLPCIFPL